MTDRETIPLAGGWYFRKRVGHPWFALYRPDGIGAPSSWSESEARAFAAALSAPAASPVSDGDALAELSRKASPGWWHGGHRCDGAITAGPPGDRFAIGSDLPADDARLAAELVNAYRAGRLIAAPAHQDGHGQPVRNPYTLPEGADQ